MFGEQPVKWKAGPWERRDYPTIMSGLVVRYNQRHGQPGESEVSASRDKVSVHAVDIYSQETFDQFVDVLRRAWKQYEHLSYGHREALDDAHCVDPTERPIDAAQRSNL